MPRRVVRFWGKLFSGYQYTGDDIAELLPEETSGPEPVGKERWTETDGDGDGMAVLPAIPYISSCENHLLPFFGVAYVGFLPDRNQAPPGDVSKLVDALSRRLQLQERLTGQICDALQGRTGGVAVMLQGNYLCPMVQGRNDRGSTFQTTAFSGGFKASEAMQSRFIRLCNQDTGN